MQKPLILVVNDHQPSLLALHTLLQSAPRATEYELVTAQSGDEALRQVLNRQFAVILLDVSMPGMDGFETARMIHSHPWSTGTPIIFITAHDADDANRMRGFEQGAADYMISPVVPQILHAKVAVFIELHRKTLQLQAQRQALAVMNRDLQVEQMRELERINAALQAQIEERRRAEQRAQALATRDVLTGLLNRRSLTERLEQALGRARRHREQLALLFFDMDRFKSINDALGHPAGDELLIQIASRLRKAVREVDHVARLGGDEFVVLMEGLGCYTAAAEVAKKIAASCAESFTVQGQDIRTSASVGISLFPQDGSSVHELMRNADLAMYHAKQERRGSVQFFHEELNVRLIERRKLEHELQLALENSEFELYYQPKVDMRSGAVAGVEALLRWHHPRLGILSGGEFIPAAIETGLVISIGQWVIESACAQARRWRDAQQDADGMLRQGGLPNLPIAVNIAIPQLYADLPRVIHNALQMHAVPACALQLEITESLVIDDVEKATSVLREISDSGITIAMDDFGTGYSSLSVLKTLPIDILKIDQSFVRDLGRDLSDNAIVAAVVNMARALALRVVAEGVETEEQLGILRDLGCDEHQGYLFSCPLPVDRLEQRLLQTSMV